MTWHGLVWRNLMRRRARTALTSAGVALGVALIVALLAVAEGVERTAADLIHVGRSDFGLFQRGAADLTRSLLPEELARRISREPGVQEAARLFLRVGPAEGRDSFLVFGLARGEFPERRLVVLRGRKARDAEAMLGDAAARSLRLGPGDVLQAGGRRFPIVGVYHTGNRFQDGGAILPLLAVQELAERPGDVTTVAVEVTPGARPGDVARRLERRFPGLAAVTEPGQAVRVDTSSRLILEAGWIFSLLALIVGGIGVTNTMAMSVVERTREIGILRAVGWPARRIAGLIVAEAVGIALLALGVGLALGYAAAEAFTGRGAVSDLVEARYTPAVFAWGLAFALGVALLGAAWPTWRAARLTPIEALRHE